jgi:cytochrome c peroxidase
LRNIAKTSPYLHDGSVETLPEMVRIMGRHQLGTALSPAQVKSIASFLASLTGRVDAEYISMPALPESGPNTPAPDPS